MFAKFNKKFFPTVIVKFLNNTITEESYNNFINEWNEIDAIEKNYNFFFDTTLGLGNPNIKFAYKLSNFLRSKKLESKKYLEYSIIYTTRAIDIYLLNIIFSITSPIAKVFVIDNIDKEYLKYIYTRLNNKETVDCLKKYE